jgi:two-component system, LytTR family, response regulator
MENSEGQGLLRRPHGGSVGKDPAQGRGGEGEAPETRPLQRSPATPQGYGASLRVLVAEPDDETRERLRGLLAATPGLAVSGVVGDGPGALASLTDQLPDLALIALDLPEIDGASVVARVGAGMPPFVALGGDLRSALRAFEIGALDFLLRPVEAERADAAVERARAEVERRRVLDLARRLAQLSGELEPPPRRRPPQRVLFRLPGRLLLFDANEIEWIEAAGNYVKVHASGRPHLVRETLESVQARLGPDRFVRLHRSALVNLDSIQELVYEGAGEISTVLKSGTRLPTSRSYRERLESALRGVL